MADVPSLVNVDRASSLGDLSPAFKALLQQMAKTYEHITFGRKRCKDIIQRAAVIINLADSNACNNQKVIATLQRKLGDVRATLQKLAEMSFFKSLLRFEKIDQDIERAYRQLVDCSKLFPMIDLSSHVQAQKAAVTSDQETLKALLEILSGNYEEICRRLDIHSDEQVNQAMAVMERELRNARSTSEKHIPVEVQVIHKCLECIKSTTGRSAPKQQEWLITEYDLDYCGNIGSGGFATVSKALFRGTMVAVKTFKDPGNTRKILEHEVAIWRRLRHDHIVPFYGASILTSPHFIVSRYMQNGSLARYLVATPKANRTKLLFEVSLGMYYLHEEDVVHGDLKAVNVLVDDSGKACITDFGLSKVWSSGTTVTEKGTVAGTLRYLAPEALRGQPLSRGTDTYAFGMLIYEVFTGEVPFVREPDRVVINGLIELQRPTSKSVYERGFNDALWQLLSDCISKKPSVRPRFKTIHALDALKASAPSLAAGAGEEDTDWGLSKCDQPGTQSKRLAGPTMASISKSLPSPGKGKSTPVERHGTSSETTLWRDIETSVQRSAECSESNRPGTLCSSPTLIGSTFDPFKLAKAAPMEQPGRKPFCETSPMCIVVTHKYFDVTFGISSRKPCVYIEKADTPQWQPIVANKRTLFSWQGDKSDASRGSNSWVLDGDKVRIQTSFFSEVCHFKDARMAERWFNLQRNYVLDESVDDWEATVGHWSRTERSWRRVERGKVQEAALVKGSPRAVPIDGTWNDVDLPKRCVIDSRTATEIVCTIKSTKRPDGLSCKLEGGQITFKASRMQGNELWVSARDETYPSVEYAEMTFQVLKTTLERASERKQKLFPFALNM